MDLASLGRDLADLRKEVGLTQEQLASSLGYSRSVVANAERGRGISQSYIDAFARAFPQVEGRLQAAQAGSLEPVDSPDNVGDEDEYSAMFFRRSTVTTDLDGTWFALWESTADNEEVINAEELRVRMRRNGRLEIWNLEASPDNPKGGYRWIADCRLFDNQYILGTYISREPNVRSKGALYLVIHRSGRFINGQWIGCNYDGDWARGLVVFARERSPLPELLRRHRRELPPMPYGHLNEGSGGQVE